MAAALASSIRSISHSSSSWRSRRSMSWGWPTQPSTRRAVPSRMRSLTDASVWSGHSPDRVGKHAALPFQAALFTTHWGSGRLHTRPLPRPRRRFPNPAGTARLRPSHVVVARRFAAAARHTRSSNGSCGPTQHRLLHGWVRLPQAMATDGLQLHQPNGALGALDPQIAEARRRDRDVNERARTIHFKPAPENAGTKLLDQALGRASGRDCIGEMRPGSGAGPRRRTRVGTHPAPESWAARNGIASRMPAAAAKSAPHFLSLRQTGAKLPCRSPPCCYRLAD